MFGRGVFVITPPPPMTERAARPFTTKALLLCTVSRQELRTLNRLVSNPSRVSSLALAFFAYCTFSTLVGWFISLYPDHALY